MNNKSRKDLIIYKLTNPNVCFRICETIKSDKPDWCTNYNKDGNFGQQFSCAQDNVHFYCSKHNNVELVKKDAEEINFTDDTTWWCIKCEQCDKSYKGIHFCTKDAIRVAKIVAESERLKNEAQVVTIDEQCSELKIKKLKTNTPSYTTAWGKIETDIVGNPQINLYVACSDDKGKKVHYFIEPEVERIRHELSETDIDPSTVISKIEITLKGRKIRHEYD